MSNNKAEQGSALYIRYRSLNRAYIRNSTFENNDSKEHGAIFVTLEGGMIEI